MASIIKSLLLVAVLGLPVFAGHANAGVNTNVITSNATPSPDFDGDNWVGFTDFVIFASVFGSRQGDGSGKYEAKYDLDGDGEIGFGDFLIFAGSFGKEPPSSGGGDGGSPDLVVQSPSASSNSVASGASFTLSATVRNEGDGSSAATTLRYYRSDDATVSTGGAEVGTDAVDGLSAAGASAESIDLTAPSSSGTYYYGACVDPVTGESDTGNNCSIGVRVIVEEPDTTPVSIPDANLREAIEAALGKTSGAPITQAEMATLTHLEASFAGIRDLTGLEFATNLTSLDFWTNEITDVSPLAGLTNLTGLTLSGNNITDISPLAGLTNLTGLTLNGNNITDISLLSGLTNLTWLQLLGNNITDVSPLSGLTNLNLLSFGDTEITDISALSGLTNLTLLEIPLNNITEISALSGLTNLTWLSLWGNNITDISPLGGLTKLRSLVLSNNNITDISLLSGLTNLTWLELGHLDLMDISPLGGLTNLSVLDLSFNNITDISSLVGLTNLTELDLRGNALSFSSINDHIPTFKSSGVRVFFDRFLREGDFDIELVFLDPFTLTQKEVLQYAARRWMSVITEDLPDYEFTQGWSGTCGDQSFEIPSGERIDDLRIYVTSFDDNPDAVGWGRPDLLREATYLPVLGCMAFDLERANLLITGLHEVGHALGFGTVWDNLGFYQNPPDGDQHFNGPLAIAAFDDAGGRDYTGKKVPVSGAHWRRSAFWSSEFPESPGELMMPGGGGALSAITVQSFADLGYGVDVTQADPYTLPGAAAKASAKIVAAMAPTAGMDVTRANAYTLPGVDPHWQGRIADLPLISGDDRGTGRPESPEWIGGHPFDLRSDRQVGHLARSRRAVPELLCGAGFHRGPIYVVDPQGRIVRTLGD